MAGEWLRAALWDGHGRFKGRAGTGAGWYVACVIWRQGEEGETAGGGGVQTPGEKPAGAFWKATDP